MVTKRSLVREVTQFPFCCCVQITQPQAFAEDFSLQETACHVHILRVSEQPKTQSRG
jgi:hypothetical protein